MAREWQQTKQKEYVLPYEVYYQCLWAVRDFDRMRKRLVELKDMSRKNSVSTVNEPKDEYVENSSTDKLNLEMTSLARRIDAIQKALMVVPQGHRKYVMANIVLKDDGKYYPDNMWRIWKQRFLFQVAKNLYLY